MAAQKSPAARRVFVVVSAQEIGQRTPLQQIHPLLCRSGRFNGVGVHNSQSEALQRQIQDEMEIEADHGLVIFASHFTLYRWRQDMMTRSLS